MKHRTVITALCLLTAFTAHGQSALTTNPAVDSMAATERAFAAASLTMGIRGSFMSYFADSALAFSPAPIVYKRVVSALPPQANPLARSLRWEPIAGDAAASGELGYLMGPSTLTDQSKPDLPVHYGFYLSVWKKQTDGAWKVIIDIGTDARESITRFFGQPFTYLRHGAVRPSALEADTAASRIQLIALDRNFTKAIADKGLVGAYDDVLDGDARAIREGVGPVIGKDSILLHLSDLKKLRVLAPMNAEASLAGDLGYTYGAYYPEADAATPSGYYVRIWKKNPDGVWKLVVDKTAPVEGQ